MASGIQEAWHLLQVAEKLPPQEAGYAASKGALLGERFSICGHRRGDDGNSMLLVALHCFENRLRMKGLSLSR